MDPSARVPFDVNTTNGCILLNDTLDREATDKYSLLVQVSAFKWNCTETRKCACKARYFALQVMDLQVKYHCYTMCILHDMDLNQEPNQSVTEGRTDVQG